MLASSSDSGCGEVRGFASDDEICNGLITVIRAVGVHPKLADTLAAVLIYLMAYMFACVSVFGLGCCGGCS